jgi:AcrR family transcriptional regulator
MPEMTFQRARSEEQRRIRRQAILDTAAAMLAEMPVSQLSLNELSRRVGLAKSNVLRYFESREDVLLELLDQATQQWVSEVADLLSADTDAGSAARQRGDQLAAIISSSLEHHTVLCDLLNAEPGILEHNVSVDVVARFKRSTLASLGRLAAIVRDHLPEVGEDAWSLCLMAVVTASALWAHAQPAPNALAAYEAEPALRDLRLDLVTSLETTLATLISGTLARRNP